MMLKIKFDKFLHDTGKAILIRINGSEHWIPKALCRNVITNSKLGGNVCVPTFIAEKMGIEITEDIAEITIVQHIPKKKEIETRSEPTELLR